MGQQQLLVLVFGIVSVGALVVLGAYAVREHQSLENRQMVVQEALEIVAALQAWKEKPAVEGGGSGLHGYGRVTFSTLGYPHTLLSNRVYKTEHGCYFLQLVSAARHAEVIFSTPTCARGDFMARVVVQGPGPGDLTWHHTPPTPFNLFP